MAQKRWEAKQKTLARVRKRFGPEVFVQFSGGEAPVEECLSTGHQHLDDILSGVTDKGLSIYGTGKGLPFGRIVEIYGPEGQGKTTLALFILARAQRAGYEVAFIDAEHSLHLQYAQTMGVDIDKLLYNQPDGAEDVFNLIREFARDGVVRVVVVDSSAALEPAADLEADIGDAQVARQARLMSQALKRLVGDVKRGKLLVIFISQVRAKIGAVAFGPQTQATGGKALKFFASIRLEMYNKGQIKAKGGRRLGTRCGIKCVKNKVAPPFREVFADNVFGKGFVNVYPGDEALMGKEEKSEEEA